MGIGWLKLQPDESFKEWIHRVQQYEFGRALMRLAQDQDPESVMSETSHRIMKKLQHPVIQAIGNSVLSSYNSAQSQAQYQHNYLDRFGPKSDHIEDK